jgi:heat shock protein 4
MAAIDRREQDRQAAKNDVEECVYGTREKLYSQYDSFATDQEKEAISAILTKTEDWLYEEGENETKQVYINKKAELTKLSASIVLRFTESESRGAVIEELGAKIQQARKFLAKYQEKDETVVHILEAEVEKVSKATTDCGNWYDNSMNQINVLKKTQDPLIFTANFKTQLDALKTSIDKIMNTPIPVKIESPYVDDVEEEKKEEPPVDASAEKTDAQEADAAYPDKNGDEKAPHMDVD